MSSRTGPAAPAVAVGGRRSSCRASARRRRGMCCELHVAVQVQLRMHDGGHACMDGC